MGVQSEPILLNLRETVTLASTNKRGVYPGVCPCLFFFLFLFSMTFFWGPDYVKDGEGDNDFLQHRKGIRGQSDFIPFSVKETNLKSIIKVDQYS